MKVFKAVKEYVRRNPHVWYALYLPVYLVLFFLVEKLVPSDSDYWVSYMKLDDYIPFVDVFVIPYCLWYPFLVCTGVYLLVNDGENFKKYMRFIGYGFTISLLFCLIVPNGQNLRPASFDHHNFFTWLIGRIYAADTNTNVFPSMHVVGVIAASSACFKNSGLRRFRWPAVVLSVFICMATVFIKQHSCLDIIGGVALGIPLYVCIYVLPDRRKKKKGAVR